MPLLKIHLSKPTIDTEADYYFTCVRLINVLFRSAIHTLRLLLRIEERLGAAEAPAPLRVLDLPPLLITNCLLVCFVLSF